MREFVFNAILKDVFHVYRIMFVNNAHQSIVLAMVDFSALHVI